jgi:hypothetical protein
MSRPPALRVQYLHVFEYTAPTYDGCSESCAGETCDYWVSQGFSCDDVKSCDCSGCSQCNFGTTRKLFEGDDKGSALCVDDDGGTRAVFESSLDAGEYLVVIEGSGSAVGRYELSLECMSLTGIESVDVSSAVVLSGISCDDFGDGEQADFVSGLASTLTSAMGATVSEEKIHSVTCATYGSRRRRHLLSSMVTVGFTATLAASTFDIDDDTGDDVTDLFQTQLSSAGARILLILTCLLCYVARCFALGARNQRAARAIGMCAIRTCLLLAFRSRFRRPLESNRGRLWGRLRFDAEGPIAHRHCS